MPAAAPAPVETAPVEVVATPEPEPVAPPVAAEPAAEAAPAPVATAVQVLEPVVALEPAPLGDRVRFAAGIGAVMGLILGVVLALAASPLVVDRATIIGEDPYRAGVEVTLTWFIVLTAIASAVFGALIASASRLMPAWFHPEMMLRGSVRATSSMGAIIGAVFGTIGAALASGLVGETVEAGAGGVPGETVQTAVVLSVGGTFLALLIGGAILGALVAAVVQLLGEPTVLPADIEAEANVVKRRLAGSILIPLAGLTAIALIVLPLALLFLEFPVGATALAIVASAGILMFAFLAAYKPGLRITRNEFILAAVGIGIVLLFIALAVFNYGPAEEAQTEEAGALLRLLLT